MDCYPYPRFSPVPTRPAFEPLPDNYAMWGGQPYPSQPMVPRLAPPRDSAPQETPLEPIPAPQASPGEDTTTGQPRPWAPVAGAGSWVFRPTVAEAQKAAATPVRVGLRQSGDRR